MRRDPHPHPGLLKRFAGVRFRTSPPRTAMPRGPASGTPSGMSGTPVLSEKRTVALTGLPCRCRALDRVAAEGAGVNSPAQTTPLACAAREPGCLPKRAFIASTICSGRPSAAARARAGPARAAAIALIASRLRSRWVMGCSSRDARGPTVAETRWIVAAEAFPREHLADDLPVRDTAPAGLLSAPVRVIAALAAVAAVHRFVT